MSNNEHYKLVNGVDAVAFQNRVNDLLNDGYQLHGNLNAVSALGHNDKICASYSQALIKL